MHKFNHVYAYIRFSSDPQADGFSFERQRDSALKWTRENGIPDDCVEFVEDAGFSAYSGAHFSSGSLGKLFSRLSSTVREGNELVLFEAVDRASRQGLFKFSQMINQFLETGVFVHFFGEDEPFSKDFPPRGILEIKLALLASLAREESHRKSIFSSNNWKNKRARAYEGGVIITKECPRWLRVENDEFVIDLDRVASIHAVFGLAKQGWGIGKIVRYANDQKWTVPGNGSVWHNSLLNRLFSNRALIGEFQPHVKRGHRKVPEGEPIQNYYPPVLDAELFYSVRATRSTVAQFPNRRDEHNYNYLQGLGRCECGGTWRRVNKQSGKQRGYAQYSCSNRQIGATRCSNLSARYFDHNFIAELCIQIPGFLAKIRSTTIDKGAASKDELRDVESRLSRLVDNVELNGDPAGVFTARINILLARKTELLREIEKFRTEPIPDSLSFSKIEAMSVYIPAFLSYYEDIESDDARNAFEARALFRVRLLSIVEQVSISLCRTKIDVLLKDGAHLPLSISSPDGDSDATSFGVAPEDAIENDFDIEGDRRQLEELEKIKPFLA